MATPADISPPCSVCLRDDRMVSLERVVTDFGGIVDVWVCRGCGVAAVLTGGNRQRPGGGNGNIRVRLVEYDQ